jgi:hypothetical protein
LRIGISSFRDAVRDRDDRDGRLGCGRGPVPGSACALQWDAGGIPTSIRTRLDPVGPLYPILKVGWKS